MRKVIAALLSLLMILPLAATASALPLATDRNRSVLITVIDENGAPLPEAIVQLSAPGSAAVANAKTDSRGQTSLSMPDGFSFWVRVWADGYAVLEQPYVPAGDGPVLTLRPTPYYTTIVGFVTDDLGRPVKDAVVKAIRDGFGVQASATSTETGAFEMTHVPLRGTSVLHVEAIGYQPYVQTDLVLTPGERNQVDVTLTTAAGSVTGEVINSRTNQPVPGVAVDLILNGWGIVKRSATDSFGAFRLDAPPVDGGTYQVRVSGNEYETVASASFTVTSESWVDFSGGDHISLNPLYAELSGYVLSEAGSTQANVIVELQKSGFGTVESAKTDQDGFFTFEKVPAGTYRVRALPEGSQIHGDSGWITLVGGDRTGADVTTPFPDSETFGSSAIVGTVRDQNGNPLQGAKVVAHRGDTQAEATTDSQGRYRLSVSANVESGIDPDVSTGYHVYVTRDGYISTDQPDNADGADAASLFDVRAKATNRADFTLLPARSDIAGRVLDERGRALANLNVALVQEGSISVAHVTTDTSGRYRFSSLEVAKQARYLPVVQANGYYEGSMAADGSLTAPIALNPGTLTSVTLTARPSLRTIQGIVKAGPNDPAAGATVTVTRPADGKAWTAHTSEQGLFTVAVPSGPADQYLVKAGSTGVNAAAVSLADNHAVVANLAVLSTAVITGKVYDTTGQPAPGAKVTLWVEGKGSRAQQVTTDSTGTYRFADLEPGRRYAVIAWDGLFAMSALAPGEPILTPLIEPAPGETVWADVTAPAR